jgi:hypothetical protein
MNSQKVDFPLNLFQEPPEDGAQDRYGTQKTRHSMQKTVNPSPE